MMKALLLEADSTSMPYSIRYLVLRTPSRATCTMFEEACRVYVFDSLLSMHTDMSSVVPILLSSSMYEVQELQIVRSNVAHIQLQLRAFEEPSANSRFYEHALSYRRCLGSSETGGRGIVEQGTYPWC